MEEEEEMFEQTSEKKQEAISLIQANKAVLNKRKNK